MGRRVKTREREHAGAVKNFDPKKSALYLNVLVCDCVIDWENFKNLKSESHIIRCRAAEIFLISQKAKEINVLNRNDGAILSGVCKLVLNCLFLIYKYNFTKT